MIETATPVTAAAARTPRFRPAWAAVAATLLGLLGVGFRGWLTLMDAPPTNSDEATMGLAALHIAAGRDLPVFFYGQQYMGTIEAYLAAPIVAVFGPSTLALRIPTLACYAAFLVTIYLMTRRLYSPGLAVLTVGLLAFGADRVVKNQLIAGGGYPEISPITVLLVLIAAGLGMRTVRRRGLAYAAWGVLAGLALWDHWLVLPYLAAATVVLLVGCGRELRGRAGLIVAGSTVLGAAPLLIHNLTGPLRENSIAVFLHLNSAGTNPPLADRLDGGVLFGLPLGTGLCSPSVCAPWQRWWAPVYLVLLVAAAVLAVRALRATGTDKATGTGDATDLRADRVRQTARLALLCAAALSLLSYARSPAAADSPVESARYLGLLLVSTPAVLWPLWALVTRRAAVPGRARRLTAAAAAVPLIALVGSMALASVALARQAPAYRQAATGDAALISALDRLRVTTFYTGYWTCNRLAFATDERAVCAVLGDDLRPGFNRYLPYRDRVAAAGTPAYVTPVGSPFDARVAAHLAASQVPFQVVEAGGHRVYLPTRRVDPPAA